MSSNNTFNSSLLSGTTTTPGGMSVSSTSPGQVTTSSGSHLGYTYGSNTGPGANIWDTNGNWQGKVQ